MKKFSLPLTFDFKSIEIFDINNDQTMRLGKFRDCDKPTHSFALFFEE